MYPRCHPLHSVKAGSELTELIAVFAGDLVRGAHIWIGVVMADLFYNGDQAPHDTDFTVESVQNVKFVCVIEKLDNFRIHVALRVVAVVPHSIARREFDTVARASGRSL
jgi:hypothetical protein